MHFVLAIQLQLTWWLFIDHVLCNGRTTSAATLVKGGAHMHLNFNFGCCAPTPKVTRVIKGHIGYSLLLSTLIIAPRML